MNNQQVTPGGPHSDDQRHGQMPLRNSRGQLGVQGRGTSVTQQGRAMVTPVLPESLWHGLGAGLRVLIPGTGPRPTILAIFRSSQHSKEHPWGHFASEKVMGGRGSQSPLTSLSCNFLR